MNGHRLSPVRSSFAGALVAAMLVTASFSSGATTECKDRKCIQVAYEAQSKDDPSNKYCWLDQWAPDPFFFVGYAYDDTYAASGYVTDAKGGNAQTLRVDGKKRRSRGTPDCPAGERPVDLPPVSGRVDVYLAQNSEDAQFNTQCSGTK